ncbi:MAG: Asp-tRNA(Asn)/Glu-tRNA(Gln) amidotransferase subunit GatC [Oligoflexia bacterium]|nr:Asp-tRNA(Asn)/Glu-tRNA(Gln) amidotransferase subunit GatC [Oligoflexia bacterium]
MFNYLTTFPGNGQHMINEDGVLKLARLARLKIDKAASIAAAAKLNSILGYVEQLMKVNVEGVEPMSHVHGSTNVYRADEVRPSPNPDAMLQNVPDSSGRFVRVPIIVE